MEPRNQFNTYEDFLRALIVELLHNHRGFVLEVLTKNGVDWPAMSEGEVQDYMLQLARDENPFFFELIPYSLRKNATAS